MVAAWIRAETGVGPSIASGSQVWNGTWADLANAPTSSSRQMATITPWLVWKCSGAVLKIPSRSKVPSSRKMKRAAITIPMSPITLITKAFMPALVAVVAPVPEADQRVGGEADEGPADDQQDQVAGQDQQQHREDEEVEVGEEAVEAPVRGQVADRVEVDQHRDAADDQAHVDRERVDQDVELDVEARRAGVVVERGGELALIDRQVEELDQHPDRGEEGEPDHPGGRIQPAERPGKRRQPKEMIRLPASGKASTSQPYVVALHRV